MSTAGAQMYPERSTDTASKRARGRRWAAIAGVAVAAILAGGVFALVISGRDDARPLASEASPTPSAEQPTATPTPVPTASAAPSPTPEPPAAGIVVLEPVSFALNTVDRLSLRAEPGLDGERLGSLSADSVSVVLDGPVSADGYTWYHLSGLGLHLHTGCGPRPGGIETDPWDCPVWLGWVAAASLDGEAWLVPVSREEAGCLSSPLSADDFWRMGVVQALGCFASEEITVRGWYPRIPDDAGIGYMCPPHHDEAPGWLMCPSGALAPDDNDWGPFGGPFEYSIDPAAGVVVPDGQWVEVTGFYDHPLARRCGDYVADPADAAATTLECRTRFVATDVRVVSGP